MSTAERFAVVMRAKLRAAGHDLVELRTREDVQRFFTRQRLEEGKVIEPQ